MQEVTDYTAIPAPTNLNQILVVHDREFNESHVFNAMQEAGPPPFNRLLWFHHISELEELCAPLFYTILNLPTP